MPDMWFLITIFSVVLLYIIQYGYFPLKHCQAQLFSFLMQLSNLPLTSLRTVFIWEIVFVVSHRIFKNGLFAFSVQLALEQHSFELHKSTYTQSFSVINITQSVIGWMYRCGDINTEDLHILMAEYKLHMPFQMFCRLVLLIPKLFKDQLYINFFL